MVSPLQRTPRRATSSLSVPWCNFVPFMDNELPNLPRSDDLILRGCQLPKGKGSPAVQLLRADPHLRAESELAAIGEPGRSVPIHRCRIHQLQELLRILLAGGDDSLRMLRRITI